MEKMYSEISATRTSLLPAEVSWEAWAGMYTDLPLWEPVIQEICRQQDYPVQRITAGFPGTNAVFLLDDRSVIKIAPPQCREDQQNELDISLALTGRLPVPGILASGVFTDRIDWPWFLMEYKPGFAAREVRGGMERTNWLGICREAGRLVREIHATPLGNLKSIDSSQKGWRSFCADQQQKAIEALRRTDLLDAAGMMEAKDFLDAQAFPEEPLVLVNADLTEDHLLLVEVDGCWRISALIDLADGRVAPSAFEWPALWFGLLGRDKEALIDFLDAYQPGLKPDDAFRRILLGFTLLHPFGRNMLSDAHTRMGKPTIRSLSDLIDRMFWPSSS